MIKRMVIQFCVYVLLASLVALLAEEYAINTRIIFFIAYLGGMLSQIWTWESGRDVR